MDHLEISFHLQCKVITLSSCWEKLLPQKEEEEQDLLVRKA